MEQVENFEENSDYALHSSRTTTGDEITDNIWNNCYIVQCNAGYKLNPVTAECIYQGS